MISALIVLSLLTVMVLSLLGTSVDSSKRTARNADEVSVRAAAESAVALAVNRVWGGFIESTGGAPAMIWDFQGYLGELGIPDQAAVAGEATDLVPLMSLAVNPRGEPVVDGVVVSELTVRREDDFRTTRLHFDAELRSNRGADDDGRRRVVTESVRSSWEIGAGEWKGLEYALLANNLNCILCHTTIDNVRRVYNTDESLYGTFDRVKLGSIESFQFREDPMSTIAGTLYLGGSALFSNAGHIDDWGDISLNSCQFDQNGKLLQDSFGDLVAADLDVADGDPMGNLYLDYLAPGVPQLGGELPGRFPAPFPDDGGYDFDAGQPAPQFADNKVVDDTEFDAATRSCEGVVSGGHITVIGAGDTIQNDNDLTAMLGGTDEFIRGVTEGSVLLSGTATDPVVLNGSVAIDGDLIIQGYVKGAGSLNVRGNVYLIGDVQYADGTDLLGNRTYGVAADGTQNVLAIAAGGNMTIGNPFRPAWGNGAEADGHPTGSYNFVMEEMGAFNRMEWMRTQAMLPGPKVTVVTGYKYQIVTGTKQTPVYTNVKTGNKIQVPVYKTVTTGTPPYTTTEKVLTGYKWVDETVKVQTGTKTVNTTKWVTGAEPASYIAKQAITATSSPPVENPFYEGPDYLPRYYALTEGGKVPIYNKNGGYFDPVDQVWVAPERAGSWSTNYLTIGDPKNKNDSVLYNADGTPKAVVSVLSGTDGWISDAMLKKLMKETMEGRELGTLHIDATLYSNNSIFGLVPGREMKGTDGSLVINGGIVAADLGLLAPKSLNLNYDSRGKDMFDIDDDAKLDIKRILWVRN